jgi:F-type H+-transporting ATPase subunit delta
MPLIDKEPDALAEIYATSLYQLADQAGGRGAVESTLAELDDLMEISRGDPHFSEFLASRVVPASQRSASLDRILKGRCSDLTLRFLQILNTKGRLAHLTAIVAAFDRQVQEKFGRIEVDVYTASPATQDELNSVREQIQSRLGREPVLHAYVEPSMIGGLKLQIGDQLIDGSVSTQLRRLKDQFAQRGAPSVRAKFDRLMDS